MEAERSSRQEALKKTAPILIVEDDLEIGAFLTTAIRQETPYQALLTIHGAQALNLLQDLRPQLIILDYRLPDMDGIEFYERIRAVKDLEQIPILMISAEVPADFERVAAHHLPFLSKPFELTTLLDEIERLLA